jgi:SAM-dependent methyltransferase
VLRWFLQSGRILEVGPGGGELLASLRALGYQVDAVEHSPALAEAIRTRWGITVHGGAFEELSFGEEAYDALLSFHVIEHVPDVAAHLAKAAQVVRRGGYFLLATPNAGSWEHRIPLGLSPNYSSAHLQLFSPRSLTLFLQRAGWQVVEMSTPSYADAWLRVASSFARRLRGKKRVAERGRFARSGSTRSRRACVQLFSVATLPCRRIQEYLNGGNELFVVAKRE